MGRHSSFRNVKMQVHEGSDDCWQCQYGSWFYACTPYSQREIRRSPTSARSPRTFQSTDWTRPTRYSAGGAGPLVRGAPDLHPPPRMHPARSALQAHVPQEPLTAMRTRRSDTSSRFIRASRSSAGGWQRIVENSPGRGKGHSIFQNPGLRRNKVEPYAGIFGISDY